MRCAAETTVSQDYQGWKSYIKTHIPAPYPGIASVIARQKAEGGLICVVSHSGAENISRDYMEHFRITPDAIYGWDLPEKQRKPSSYPLEQIMQKYGLGPSELLVVDDLKPAYEMAKKVNVPIAFAAWSKLEQPEIYQQMSSLCDYTFNTPDALEKFLFD